MCWIYCYSFAAASVHRPHCITRASSYLSLWVTQTPVSFQALQHWALFVHHCTFGAHSLMGTCPPCQAPGADNVFVIRCSWTALCWNKPNQKNETQIVSNFTRCFFKCPHIPAELTEKHNTKRSDSDCWQIIKEELSPMQQKTNSNNQRAKRAICKTLLVCMKGEWVLASRLFLQCWAHRAVHA